MWPTASGRRASSRRPWSSLYSAIKRSTSPFSIRRGRSLWFCKQVTTMTPWWHTARSTAISPSAATSRSTTTITTTTWRRGSRSRKSWWWHHLSSFLGSTTVPRVIRQPMRNRLVKSKIPPQSVRESTRTIIIWSLIWTTRGLKCPQMRMPMMKTVPMARTLSLIVKLRQAQKVSPFSQQEFLQSV